jgi:ethanolamine utilization protein EutN
MRIAHVIGVVTLSRCHPSLVGGVWKLAVPLALAELRGRLGAGGEAEDVVVYDEWQAAVGSLIAYSDGAEAAQPFLPDVKPIDAYNAALLDDVAVDGGERVTRNERR